MRLPMISLLLLLLASCSNSTSFTSVEIETVYQDSLSIRAIYPVSSEQVWFAANNGRVGLIDGDVPKLATIQYEEQLLHFRSIAGTSNSVFVLSIGSPAVLYKIGFDGSEATNIEEVYSETGEGVFYDSMRFWNDKEGIAMGDPVDGCLSVLITRDGGNRWEKLSCEDLPATENGEAAFAASNSNIAIVGDHTWLVSGGMKARVFYSPDKGKNWEVFNSPIIQGKEMTGIYSVDFVDEKRGVVFGGNWEDKEFNEGNKAVTEDGGRTWTLVSNGSGPGYRSSVRYVPGSGGSAMVAVGSPGISYSDDSGASWTELSKEGFYAIEFVNDSIAFASGKNRISRLKFK